MSGFKLYTLFFCECTSLFKGKGVKINTRIFFNGVKHSDSFKIALKIKLYIAVFNNCRAENRLCGVADKTLNKIHHSVIIGVCLIKLHKSKLGVVTSVKSLVSEYSAYRL